MTLGGIFFTVVVKLCLFKSAKREEKTTDLLKGFTGNVSFVSPISFLISGRRIYVRLPKKKEGMRITKQISCTFTDRMYFAKVFLRTKKS